MKRLLKITSVLVVLTLAACLSACGKTETAKMDIAMITTEKSSLNDGNFNQSTFEGIKRYAENNNVTYEVYPPESRSEDDYLKAMETANKAGAQVIITPGFNFETTVFAAQELYPDIHFVLIDGVPNDGKYTETSEKIAPNTYSVLFAEEQAGFLAGYAIVKDGFKNLAFLGGREFPAVVSYGHGFVQGAEFAAKELGLPKGEVEVRYDYAGNFEPTPENQAKAAAWYNDGVEVIFACGGAMGNSVIQAANSMQEKWVIGVDTDQSGDSDIVITSALKMIANSVDSALKAHYDGTFPGGESIHLGANVDGVGLAMDNARFRTFTKAEYEKIYTMLAENQDGIASSIIKDMDVAAKDLPCVYVTVK